MYLFTNIKYSRGGQEIERLNLPIFSTTRLRMVTHSLEYAKGPGLLQCWYPDTTTVAKDANVGFTIRLGNIVKNTNPKDLTYIWIL